MGRRNRKLKIGMSLILCIQLVLPPFLFAQQPTIPGLYSKVKVTLPEVAPAQLPAIRDNGFVQGVAGLSKPNPNRLVVHQDQPKAILEWESFNIGKDAWTHFDQQGNANWAALNRIYDQNPSLIYGKLSADGQVFLINQNGILFGPDSQINVNTLTASSLNLKNEDFVNDLWQFKAENYMADPNFDMPGAVSNHGAIETSESGGLIFLAPELENYGSLKSPKGTVVLGAGSDEVAIPVDEEGVPQYRSMVVSGAVGVVNQEGLIRTVTAEKTDQGLIVLKSADRIVTGSTSQTAAGSVDLEAQTEVEHQGVIETTEDGVSIAVQGASGQDAVVLKNGSQVVARASGAYGSGGSVSIQATSGNVTVEDGARIDVVHSKGEDAVSLDIKSYLELLISGELRPLCDLDGGSVWIETSGDIILDGEISGSVGRVMVQSEDWKEAMVELFDELSEDDPEQNFQDKLDQLASGLSISDLDRYDSLAVAGESSTFEAVSSAGVMQNGGSIAMGSFGSVLLTSYQGIDTSGSVTTGDRGQIRMNSSEGTIRNSGTIATGNSGSVYTVAPTIENSGDIVSPYGQIGMAAASTANWEINAERGVYIPADLTNTGTIRNMEGALIAADFGHVGLYGKEIYQEGTIRATTGVVLNSRIELRAEDKVYTGTNSLTYTPISTSRDTAHESFTFNAGRIDIGGLINGSDVSLVEHHGQIVAPSGNVYIDADRRVFLGSDSLIDVSGSWVWLPVDAVTVEAVLNSYELRDDYGQKDDLLGETITFNLLSGSAIGDIEGYLTAEELSALVKSTAGGTIDIRAHGDNGDIIVKQGARLDFSGGVIGYGDGYASTTKLNSTNMIYDVSEASQWLQYEGIYENDAEMAYDTWPGHTEGKDAGTLMLIAKKVVLDGEIDGSAFPGFYQTQGVDPVDGYGNQTAIGRRKPSGGTLIIGDSTDYYAESPEGFDFVLDDVSVRAHVAPLSASFGADPDDFSYIEERQGQVLLSAEVLNAAGLSNLEIYSNGKLEIQSDVRIDLLPGDVAGAWVDETSLPVGRFFGVAGSILHEGDIRVPSGTIRMITRETAGALPNSRVFLASGSRLATAGEEIDNRMVGVDDSASYRTGSLHGGQIFLADQTSSKGEGVFILPNAVVDVSGGYQIDTNGSGCTIKGGDGGLLSLEGAALLLEGDIRGHSPAVSNGGTIQLHADQISVVQGSQDLNIPRGLTPETVHSTLEQLNLDRKLALADDRLETTGFANIQLVSGTDIDVEADTHLTVSNAKRMVKLDNQSKVIGLYSEVKQSNPGGHTLGSDGLLWADPFYMGETSITLRSGIARRYYKAFEEATKEEGIFIQPGARLEVAPQGAITLAGPHIDMCGQLQALSGDITLTAYGFDINIGSGSRIDASGFNKEQMKSLFNGLVVGYDAEPGGTVSLVAAGSSEPLSGNLTVENGAIVDVSGSEPTTVYLPGESLLSVKKVSHASEAGTTNLSFRGDLDLQGQLIGSSKMAGVKGGTFSVSHLNTLNSQSHLDFFMDNLVGFHDMTFRSPYTIRFPDTITYEIPGILTLDAPRIQGVGNSDVHLTASWMRIVNTRDSYNSVGEYNNILNYDSLTNDANLHLSADWLDVEGSVHLTGFDQGRIQVQKDIRLAEAYYRLGSSTNPTHQWEGLLKTSADLVLSAGHIYPTTLSDFTISGGENVTIQKSGTPSQGAILSAGGSLTVEADNIYHFGILAAPLGTITLQGDEENGSVVLEPGSRLITAGDLPVDYGSMADLVWRTPDKSQDDNTLGLELETLPEPAVNLSAGSVEFKPGAYIDVSGGGMVFAHLWQAGLEGSVNPLEKAGRYVIMLENSIVVPGESVYLEGVEGLAAGEYSLLPDWCAFLPGALVITDLNEAGISVSPTHRFTEEGYAISQGYRSRMGMDLYTEYTTAFSVRRAADVLAEGHFTIAEGLTGAAGTLSIQAQHVALDGAISMQSLPKYKGGSFSISSQAIAIGQPTDDFQANIILDFSLFDDMDLNELTIGNDESEAIHIYGGTISMPKITLAADQEIVLEDGAQVLASGESRKFEQLIYQYDYQPQLWLGVVAPLDVQTLEIADSDLVLWIATLGLKTTEGMTPIQLFGDDDSFIQSLSDLQGLPTFLSLSNSGTEGLASLASDGGTLVIEEGARLQALETISLGGNRINLYGAVSTINPGSLVLETPTIAFVPDGYATDDGGIYLTQAMWEGIEGIENFVLSSSKELLFLRDFELNVSNSLTLQTARIAGEGATVSMEADMIDLLSRSTASEALSVSDDGQLNISANVIEIGFNGNQTNGHTSSKAIVLDGFGDIRLSSEEDVVFKGVGTLATGADDVSAGGNLTIEAGRVTTDLHTSTDTSGETEYYASDVRVDAGERAFALEGNGNVVDSTPTAGGQLAIEAGSIRLGKEDQENEALIQMPSGWVSLTADGRVYLGDGVAIDLQGGDYATGGVATLESKTDSIVMAAGSRIDVSGGGQGDAGTINLIAAQGSAVLNGDLLGSANGGLGGSFSLDAANLTAFSALDNQLIDGGFTEAINIRSRNGNMSIGAEDRFQANEIALTADQGSISVYGEIDASGSDEGGSIALQAGNLLRLLSGSQISATGGTDGGTVFLAGGESGDSVGLLESNAAVYFETGARIDVSGGEDGTGGSIQLRAPRINDNEVSLITNGTVSGASRVTVEAVKVYTDTEITASDVSTWDSDNENFMDNAGTIAFRLLTRLDLQGWEADQLHVVPGLDIESSGDLDVNSTIYLTNLRYGGEAGVLTLRAAGNLTINADIVDSPHSMNELYTNVDLDPTWQIRMVAGADLTGANVMAVQRKDELEVINGVTQGNLTMADRKVVYSENGDISFAAANDAFLLHGKQGAYMINSTMTYNLGTYGGNISGTVGRDLSIGSNKTIQTGYLTVDRSGGIQTALGDIDIVVGRALNFVYGASSNSAGIRTTGGAERLIWDPAWRNNPELWPEGYEDLVANVPSFPPNREQRWMDTNTHNYYHHYANGGNINIQVNGDMLVVGSQSFSDQAWDYIYQDEWSVAYTQEAYGAYPSMPVGGVATLAGGDIRVTTGGSFESKAGTFGEGDLRIFTGGDLDGKFLVRDGCGELSALANFGLDHSENRTVEAFDARYFITAQGSAVIGEVLNPTVQNVSGAELRYSQEASVTVRTVRGDVSLPTGGLFTPNLDVEAGGDIHLKDRIVLAPARSNHLRMVAGGDITGDYNNGRQHAQVVISDIAPEAAYAYYSMPSFTFTYPSGYSNAGEKEVINYMPTVALIKSRFDHGFPFADEEVPPSRLGYLEIYQSMMDEDMALVENQADREFFEAVADRFFEPVHFFDEEAAVFQAGGDIADVQFYMAKVTEITAGHNINNIYYLGQNNRSSDLSIIHAQGVEIEPGMTYSGNIIFEAEPSDAIYFVGVEQTGPGTLAVQAGNLIDLGETRGIKSIGDSFNGALGPEGCSLLVMAGLSGPISNQIIQQQIVDLYEELRTAGDRWNELVAQGKEDEAQVYAEQVKSETIDEFLANYSQGAGTINMTSSQIGTGAENSDIALLAMGDVNVGKSLFFESESDRRSTGIYTALGGDIDIFANGDVNVNESRVMTYNGGDITVYSDSGDLYAGRGARTAINVEPPKLTWVNGVPVYSFIPPAVGSGIRTLTYDPDGTDGPIVEPLAGNIYVFAPQGTIDAGEAGIYSGRDLFIGALAYENVQNIGFAGVSVGLSQNTTGLGNLALAGTGVVSETAKIAEQSAAMTSAEDRFKEKLAQLSDDLVPKWLAVEVIGFGDEDEKEGSTATR